MAATDPLLARVPLSARAVGWPESNLRAWVEQRKAAATTATRAPTVAPGRKEKRAAE